MKLNKVNNEMQQSLFGCAEYTGKVSLSVYSDNRLIKKVTAHNSGLTTLFTFIGNCLSGKFSSAKKLRPNKIILLKAGNNEFTDTEDPSAPIAGNTHREQWTQENAISIPVVYDNAPLLNVTNSSCSVSYHFRIPQLCLSPGQVIKKLLLMPTEYSNYLDACAYIILAEEDTVEIPEQSGNTTIIVDWTLNIENKSDNSDDVTTSEGDN